MDEEVILVFFCKRFGEICTTISCATHSMKTDLEENIILIGVHYIQKHSLVVVQQYFIFLDILYDILSVLDNICLFLTILQDLTILLSTCVCPWMFLTIFVCSQISWRISWVYWTISRDLDKVTPQWIPGWRRVSIL